MDASIARLREQVDRVDAQLALLLDERGRLAKELRARKRALGLAAVDPAREEQILARAAASARALGPDAMRRIFAAVLEETRAIVSAP